MTKLISFLVASVLATLAIYVCSVHHVDENSPIGLDSQSKIAAGAESVCKEGDFRCYIDLLEAYFQKADYKAMLEPATKIIEYLTAMGVKMSIPSHKLGHVYRLRAKIYVELKRYQEAVDDADAALRLNAADEHAAKVRDKARRLMLGQSDKNELKLPLPKLEL